MIKMIVSNSGVVITNTEPVKIPAGDSIIVDGEEYKCVTVKNGEYFYGFEKVNNEKRN